MGTGNRNANNQPSNTGDVIKSGINDALSYPILTEEINTASVTPAPSAGAGNAPLAQQAENAIRAVLGWRPRATDSKGFVAALTKSFELTEHEGHTDWKWTPRGFAIQADLGTLTGGQASIYHRAKVTLEQCLKVLDGLTPLDEGADKEDLASVRTIVRTHLTDLVAELGMEGGPRGERVKEFFHSLLGEDVGKQITPGSAHRLWENVGGQFGELRERFGFQGERVNTLEEEQDLTNYMVLVDYVISLYRGWNDFTRQGVFFGTQLIQFSRALEVVVESVHEACFALDSVFVGPAERQTTLLPLVGFQEGNEPALEHDIYLADLLDWIERVASHEGPQLIQDAGIDGMKALYPILESLHQHARGALHVARPDASNLSEGFRSVRVRKTLASLAMQLKAATALASDFKDRPIGGRYILEGRLAAKADWSMIESRLDNKADQNTVTAEIATRAGFDAHSAFTRLDDEISRLKARIEDLKNNP
jgi:hypothetical protein